MSIHCCLIKPLPIFRRSPRYVQRERLVIIVHCRIAGVFSPALSHGRRVNVGMAREKKGAYPGRPCDFRIVLAL